MHYNGEGVPKDLALAAEWSRKAADQGHARAQAVLATLHYNGEGVPKDLALAAEWYRKAADQGHAGAQRMLATLHYNGEGVPKDLALAAEWSRKAADQGHAVAQAFLAGLHYNGEGVPKDFALAAEWYRKAADQGHAVAQAFLAALHYNGEGVPKDFALAAEWYRKAADQGHAGAQRMLGLQYFQGLGVPSDYVSAYAWSNLAAAQGDELAREGRDYVQSIMTSNQIAEAQSLSRQIEARIATGDTTFPTDRIAPTRVERMPTGSGSGFRVGSGREVLTNHHVVKGCGQVTIKHSGESYGATIRATDATNDLALLVAAALSGQTAAFSESPQAVLGEAATVAGYPYGGLLASGLHVASGNVSALAGLRNDSTRLQITAPVQPGNSGGPLLDKSGNVIGVVVSRLDALGVARATGTIPQNVNFAIKGSVARMFLEIHGVPYRRATGDRKLSAEDIANLARGFTVAVECWK